MKKIKEGKINLWVHEKEKNSKGVFYNPDSEFNKDITISALQVFQKESKIKLNILDATAATGVRGLRYAKEVSGVKEVTLCDHNPLAIKVIRKNIKENKAKKAKVVKKDSNILMRENIYNVIDIDPYGSPATYMDSAARSIYHKGFLAVTATDQAPLCGVFPMKCLRRYGIENFKTEFYNEVGIRVLISYIILTMARYDRAFIPLISFWDKHYYRVIGRIEHGKVSKLLDEFRIIYGDKGNIGPIYLGKILDKKFCKKTLADLKKRKFKHGSEEIKLLNRLIEESNMPPFYFNIHNLRLKKVPKIDLIIEKLKKKGFKVSRTHFSDTSIKTNANLKDLRKII